jgi:hypothetical protein
MKKIEKYIRETLEFNFINKDEDSIIKGVLMDYNENWTLIASNPVDFVLDGYMIINNRAIKQFKHIENKIESKIFKIKLCDKIIIDLNSFFNFFNLNKIIISVELENFDFLIGKIVTNDGVTIDFQKLDANAEWMEIVKINIDDIYIIEFDTDYINSLCLVTK